MVDKALKQIPAQAKQRGITFQQVVEDVMLGNFRIEEMMNPIEVANLFLFGFSRFSKHLIGGDPLFDGGMVLTYSEKKGAKVYFLFFRISYQKEIRR